jgi:hypothetical protein
MRALPALAAVLVATMLGVSAAAAPSEASTYREGVKRENEGDVVGALGTFESIPAPKRDFLVRLHIASCKRKLRRFLASARDLETIIADPSADAATKETAQSDLDDLHARTPNVTVHLSSTTRDVTVSLDGEPIAPPLSRALDPGTHVVIATRGGTQVFKREVDLAESTTVDVEIHAPIVVASTPSPTPSTNTPTTKNDVPPHVGEDGTQRTVGWTLVGVGGVVALGAVGAWWQSNVAYDDYRASCGFTGCDPDKRARVETWDRWKVVGTGVAIAAVGVGVMLIVTSPPEKAAPSVSVKATAGAVTGFQIEGRF